MRLPQYPHRYPHARHGPVIGLLSTVLSNVTLLRTRSTERRKTMVSRTTARFRTPYDERVELVKNTLTTYSALDEDAAGKLAVHVLHALNSIPEKVR
jgi:hypothetical protein